MTRRPNDQKDVNQPAFSPDGRFLYYIQDITPGAVFEYNKDPNTEVFVIQRLDRTTGKTERFVTGAGGSLRPTPSPDGKLLAFIRRVRGKSVLHLEDLRSGEDWPLYDGLDKDQQETWTIHGTYPAMAWMSDSRSLVFWAGGKIRRIDVASRQVMDIPFHVRSTRTLTEALRFPVQVAPDNFETKMLRWAQVAPQGDRVVYQALGHLWIKDLPNGAPRRLTRQNDHWELFPSFSRDGRSIVYTTWDDRKLSTIRVAPAAGGDGGTLRTPAYSRETGEYLHWSGDGKTLHWALGPELYSLDVRNAFTFLEGSPEKVPDPPAHGVRIGFEAASDVPTGSVAIVGGKVVTMKGDEVIPDGTVLIEGNRIRAVGPRSLVAVPAGAAVVDAKGKTVIPGLVDVHWHGPFGTDDIIPQENWVTYATLAFGVTTLHDPSNDTATVFAAAEMARAGLITAPRIFSTGTILYGATAPFTAEINSLDDARSHLRRMQAVGAISVKSYNQPRREQRQQVIAAARELGMMVVPEGGSLFEHNMHGP